VAVVQVTYQLGTSDEEIQRLLLQAELIFNPPTRRLLQDAGIRAGMKILDLGSGVGDVTLLAAELVGQTGTVVGVDLSPKFVAALVPTNGPVTVGRLLAFTPALLVISLANPFEEEFVTRSLFLKKYNWFFSPHIDNVLQAVAFSSAHASVTYTPSAALFIVVFLFPLGLFAGYLMRASHGFLAGSIFHGALDMAIYLPFLSHAS
jgi:membrane protease YdiL (CAAX protease family)